MFEDTDETKKPGREKKKKEKKWPSLGFGDVVVYSAADDSFWPKGRGDAFTTKPPRKALS